MSDKKICGQFNLKMCPWLTRVQPVNEAILQALNIVV
jgi:hypothetical protein